MRASDFFFFYKNNLYNLFFIKKKYFQGLRKIFNIPLKYIIFESKKFFLRKSFFLDKKVLKKKKLDYLFNRFNSDKGSKFKIIGINLNGHNYSKFYEKHFQKFKFKKNLKILEIGTEKGNSAAAFYHYFPDARIYCADINPFKIEKFSSRIRSLYIDTQSKYIIDKFSKYLDTKFDIIIDDGSHNIRDQIMTLKILFPCLKKNGTYVIEELTQYLAYPYLNPDNEKYTTKEILMAIKNKKKYNSLYLNHKNKTFLKNSIKKITFAKGTFIQESVNISGIVFIEKNKNL